MEKPSHTIRRFDYDKTKLNIFNEKEIAATLPKSSLSFNLKKPKEHVGLSLLMYSSPSSTELSKLNLNETDSNPLRILRNKNYPFVQPRIKTKKITPMEKHFGNGRIDHDDDASCESPSYLTNTEYSFSECTQFNAIPLPPRDRTKVMQANVKRHVRKYPLIIPVSSLQRTLNKVHLPAEEQILSHPETDLNHTINNTPNIVHVNYNKTKTEMKEINLYTKKFIENNFPSTKSSDCERTYENLESMRYQMQDCTDSASLHFELILEDDIHKNNELSSPEVSNNYIFEINKEHYLKPSTNQLFGESDELRNLDIERKKTEFSNKFSKSIQSTTNELAGNILFNKAKDSFESIESSSNIPIQQQLIQSNEFSNLEVVNEEDDKMLERKLQDTNSVSCEDLLEFSDKKPKGRERGHESDEVRIMTKVLGPTVLPILNNKKKTCLY